MFRGSVSAEKAVSSGRTISLPNRVVLASFLLVGCIAHVCTAEEGTGPFGDAATIGDVQAWDTTSDNTSHSEDRDHFLAFEHPEDFSEPVQLLAPTEGHDKFKIVPSTLALLETIDENIAVVAVVGPYHGGKSFLLNVLLNSSLGFSVGVNPEPETQGIWLRVVPKDRLQSKDGATILLLDTEGFYGAMASRTYDAKLFAVATLLSSHLIYNTLRTLGDLKSVSELSDLAKHAHVFNLHNWLHTGSPSSTEGETIPVPHAAPDLLLRTLEFPFLTWVVQGFDIDLETSDSPMAHLQRYLAAHAKGGDRSIQELFTQGVQCLALRTPTDLNRLREEIGGGGLGEERELFPILHPAYKRDVERVREAVFGSLRAKGGGLLTGRALAELLPVLVHYVNEDFPFNAEKPLRETMRGLLLESGLDGGTSYFRSIMDQSLGIQRDSRKASAPGQKKKGMGNPSTENGGKELSGKSRSASDKVAVLVAGALTPGELEKAFSTAEERAVQYCKKRCVGLPPESVHPICSASLRIRLATMRLAYQEENDKRVREALVALAEDLQLAAHQRLESVQTPMPEADLEGLCAQVLKGALSKYDEGVGKHKGGELYAQARARLTADIKAKSASTAAHNTAKIVSLLEAAQVKYRQAYEGAIVAGRQEKTKGLNGEHGSKSGSTLREGAGSTRSRKPKDGAGKSGWEGMRGPGGAGSLEIEALPLKKLQELHGKGSAEAERAFAATVAQGGLHWLGPGHKQYEFHRFENHEWSKRRLQELQAANDARLAARCKALVREIVQRCRWEFQLFRPFPDNDEVLAAKVGEVAEKLLAEYAAAVAEFVGMGGAEGGRRALADSLEGERGTLLEKNTRLMTALCYEPLQAARRDLHMQECEKTYDNIFRTLVWWSLRCLVPGPRFVPGFRQAAYKTARYHLDKAQLRLQEIPQAEARLTSSGPWSTSQAWENLQLWAGGDSGVQREEDEGEGSKGAAAMDDKVDRYAGRRGEGEAGEGEAAVWSTTLSIGTRNKVIMSWIEHDLAGHMLAVTTNFAMLAAMVVGLVGFLWWLRTQPAIGPIFDKRWM